MCGHIKKDFNNISFDFYKSNERILRQKLNFVKLLLSEERPLSKQENKKYFRFFSPTSVSETPKVQIGRVTLVARNPIVFDFPRGGQVDIGKRRACAEARYYLLLHIFVKLKAKEVDSGMRL